MIVLPVDTIVENLKKHEGFRAHVYKCSAIPPAWTIGYGRNVDEDRGGLGITEEEADYLLRNDVGRSVQELRNNFKWFDESESSVQSCLVELCFWIGLTRLKRFRRMILALAKQDRELASEELQDSLLFKQVPGRTQILADRMRG